LANNLYIITLDFDRPCSEISAELRALADIFEAGGDMVALEAAQAQVLDAKLLRLDFLAEYAHQIKPKGNRLQ
jgi:hypothetical protein